MSNDPVVSPELAALLRPSDEMVEVEIVDAEPIDPTTQQHIEKRVDAIVAMAKPLPNVEPPDVDALIKDIPTEAWLVAAMRERAANESTLWRCAAAGMFARLWMPPVGCDVAAMDVRISEGDGPADRAMKWFDAQSAEAREYAVEAAFLELTELEENELPVLKQWIQDEPKEARDGVRQWLYALDDVYCLLYMVKEQDTAERFDRVLKHYFSGEKILPIFQPVGSFHDDERLWAVIATDPTSWWGTPALQQP